MAAMKVRPRMDADAQAVSEFLARNHSSRVARRHRLLVPMDHPAFVAETDDGRLAGVLTYVPDEPNRVCEILTLHTAEQWHGAGTALIDAIVRWASERGIERLWLITTNDNVEALRFYQRRGFQLAALHRGAVTESRARLKPELPLTGNHGIEIRDEIELERLT
jgi:GNAT superfamily N-acetyltransferase